MSLLTSEQSERYIDSLVASVQTLEADLAATRDKLRQEQEDHQRTLRTVKHSEEAYLAEHGNWGHCKWKIQAEQAQARIAALEQERQWQPIETAPKDGTTVLLTDGHYRRTGYWARRCEVWSIDAIVAMKMPTHWLAIPQADARGREEER